MQSEGKKPRKNADRPSFATLISPRAILPPPAGRQQRQRDDEDLASPESRECRCTYPDVDTPSKTHWLHPHMTTHALQPPLQLKAGKHS